LSHFCWEAAEQKGWHQVLAKIRSFKEGEAALRSATELRGSHLDPVSLAARQVVVFGARQICFPNHEGQGKDLCRYHLTKQHKQQHIAAALHGAFGRVLWQVFGGFPLHFSSADKAVATAVTCSFLGFCWGLEGPGKHRNARI